MNRIAALLLTIFLSTTTLAGTATGKVSSIFVADNSDAVLFVLTSPILDTPRCNESGSFSINLRKPGGMAAYMAILEAKKQAYEISVEGLNTCTNQWKSEDTKNIVLN